jgi:uncharacterized protein YkwD
VLTITAPAQAATATTAGPITSGISGKCVDVRAANPASGTPVQLYDCNGTNAQQWTGAPDGSIHALGKCMDVTFSGTANGTLVQLWDCNGTGAQLWWPQPNGTLVNPQSGRCLDDPGGNTANGTQLVIWDCAAATDRQWNLPQLTNMLPSNQAAINAIFTQVNQFRADNGLPSLQLSNGLTASSHAHTVLMANWCNLQHQCPGEQDLGSRIRAQGVSFTTAGENIGADLPPPPGIDNTDAAITAEAENLTTAMYNETPPNDGHRINLLSPQFHHIGIDVIRATDGKIWMTQDFTD